MKKKLMILIFVEIIGLTIGAAIALFGFLNDNDFFLLFGIIFALSFSILIHLFVVLFAKKIANYIFFIANVFGFIAIILYLFDKDIIAYISFGITAFFACIFYLLIFLQKRKEKTKKSEPPQNANLK